MNAGPSDGADAKNFCNDMRALPNFKVRQNAYNRSIQTLHRAQLPSLRALLHIRAMLTHPIDEQTAKFYTRFGFIASPLRERQLLLLLKDAPRGTA